MTDCTIDDKRNGEGTLLPDGPLTREEKGTRAIPGTPRMGTNTVTPWIWTWCKKGIHPGDEDPANAGEAAEVETSSREVSPPMNVAR